MVVGVLWLQRTGFFQGRQRWFQLTVQVQRQAIAVLQRGELGSPLNIAAEQFEFFGSDSLCRLFLSGLFQQGGEVASRPRDLRLDMNGRLVRADGLVGTLHPFGEHTQGDMGTGLIGVHSQAGLVFF